MSTDPNPFNDLVNATTTNTSNDLMSSQMGKTQIKNLDKKVNNLIEKVFLFTINKNINVGNQRIFMEDVVPLSQDGLLNLELLEQALFERLLLPNPMDYIIPSDRKDDETPLVGDTKVINYLFKSFERCESARNINDSVNVSTCDQIKKLILRNASTSMKHPELYEGQFLSKQWLEIFRDMNIDSDIKQSFLVATAQEMFTDDELTSIASLKAIFYPVFNDIQKILRPSNMITVEKWIIPVLTYFVSHKNVPQLGEILIDYTTPNKDDMDGRSFTDTLLGQLLNLSILPKFQNGPYEFYDNPMDAITSSMNYSLWQCLSKLQDSVFAIFKPLLVLSPQIKTKTLDWIANCLFGNLARGQIWNSHNMSPIGSITSASDGFMLNLCGVLLRLCGPLCKPSFKVYLVDPTFSAVTDADRVAKLVHMRKVSEETCLLPTEEGETRLTAESYNFITELFFMTHKAIDLSYRVCIEKFVRISRELHRLQQAYQSASQERPETAESIMSMLRSQTQQFLCLKNCLIEPVNNDLLNKFYEATSLWLIEIAGKSQEDLDQMIAAKVFSPKTSDLKALPLPNFVPSYFKSIPEYVIENVVGYFTFIRHFEGQKQELSFDKEAQHSLFKCILVFMGSVERVRNPHLRARLAEGLESLLPTKGCYNNTDPFHTHPDRLEIAKNLLDVFVSIEMTGQSVQFEQKFNYRRPMYTIMEFLWQLKEQRNCFRALAIEAQSNMEAVNPPIFLRFVNLLINDAIFLLDESLSNIQQIRQLQTDQDNGAWAQLGEHERQQNVANLQHLGTMVRFDNILGRDTINVLKMITSEIKDIFCHQSMVDRVASMLNYFLLHLVGPKKKNFVVKDKKDLEFDPANTVMEICRIYVNLKDNNAFCLAVSQDGRCYSSELFEFAEQVLVRISGGSLILEISEFAEKVKRLEKQHMQDQEALTDPPDQYLDPIMSTLMSDPVILPSSKVTVDRTTIARHLLSDQTDPFNRSPLTMDQIHSDVNLLTEINQWIERKRKEYNEIAKGNLN